MSDPISAIVGGISQRNQAKSAGRASALATATQSAAIDDALNKQDEQYGIDKGYYQPFYDDGLKSQNALTYGLGLGGTDPGAASNVGYGSLTKPFTLADYQADPGYQFRLAEGQKALDRNASAKRMYFSGAATKGLEKYNQDAASQEYGNAYNRYNTNQTNLYNKLSGQAETGYNAGNSLSNLGSNYAANYGNLVTDKGSIQAQGVLNQNAAKSAQATANAGLVGSGINLVANAFGVPTGGGASGYNLFGG